MKAHQALKQQQQQHCFDGAGQTKVPNYGVGTVFQEQTVIRTMKSFWLAQTSL